MWYKVIFVPIAAVVGVVMGSFYNVLIYRLPRNISLINPSRSFCPVCGHQLAWRDNVPVLSYLLLKGRCRYCGARISPRYLFVEIATAVLFSLTLYICNDPVKVLALWTLYSCALVVTFIDFGHMLIPDSMVIATGVGGMAWAWRSGHFLLSLETAIGAFTFFLLLYFLSRGGIGFGDVEYFGVLGLFLNPLSAVFAVLIASLSAIVYAIVLILFRKAGRKSRIPFGPFLALGTSIAMLLNVNVFRGW